MEFWFLPRRFIASFKLMMFRKGKELWRVSGRLRTRIGRH